MGRLCKKGSFLTVFNSISSLKKLRGIPYRLWQKTIERSFTEFNGEEKSYNTVDLQHADKLTSGIYVSK